MLVQALAEFADNYLSGKLEDPAFETKPVGLELEISPDGRFLNWIQRQEAIASDKKTASPALPIQVPSSPVNRNSGVHPKLAFDDVKYVLGAGSWTKASQTADHQAKHARFVELLRRAAQDTREPSLRAYVAFYDDHPDEVARARNLYEEREFYKSKRKEVLLSVSPDGPVIQVPAVKKFWREHYYRQLRLRNKAGGTGMCLISGQWGPIAPTHDKIKGATSLGGQGSGVLLMSANKPAFKSYGWEDTANSPVSPDRAQAYVMALNHLMGARGTHRVDHGDTAFLFWLRKPSEWNPMTLLDEADPDQITRLLRLQAEGWAGLEPNEFYFLGVCGNGGRLQVSQWIHDSLDQVLSNVSRWFEGLRIVDSFTGESARPCRMWKVLSVLVREGGRVPPGWALELTRRALLGQPLGWSVLNAALARMRVEQGREKLNPVRAGLIRLMVNDEIEKKGGSKMMVELNPAETEPAYLCGRLLALFDALQYQASGGNVNLTVADRYYTLASTQPRLAFPKLEDLGLKHMRKVRREKPGAAVNIERQMDEIRQQIGSEFPPALNLLDQGRFALGYHHERSANMQRAKASKEASAARQNEEGDQQ